MKPVRLSAFLVLASLVSACATPAIHRAPPPYAVLPQGAAVTPAPWKWEDLGDRRFATLLDSTLAGNLTVETALLRVEQARLSVGDAKSGNMPQASLQLGDTASRAIADKSGNGVNHGLSAGLDVSYELDLWGRRKAAVAGARRELSATDHDLDAARITVAGELAETWFALAENKAVRALFAEQQDAAAETLAITAARVRAGAVARSDLAGAQGDQRRLDLRGTQLATERARLENALAVLQGRLPDGTVDSGADAAALDIPFAARPIPLPALAGRPDVAAAEDRIWSASYRTNEARAQLLPSINLSGGLSGSAATIAKLLSPETLILSLGASLAHTLIDGGQKQRRVEASSLDTRRAVLDYRQMVLKAVEEADNAQRQWTSIAEQIASSHDRITAQSAVLRASRTRYRVGASSLADILRDQTALYQEQEELIRLKRQRAQAAIGLLKAIGRSPVYLR